MAKRVGQSPAKIAQPVFKLSRLSTLEGEIDGVQERFDNVAGSDFSLQLAANLLAGQCRR